MNKILTRIEKAANNRKSASDYTHGLYRYPASMSPLLAREIIQSFSKEKDFVLDPFCGGGTSAIESILLGRKIICSDINPLASFLTKVKSTPVNRDVLDSLILWHKSCLNRLHNYRKQDVPEDFELTDNLHSKKTIWLMTKLKSDIKELNSEHAKDIANLILLSVGKNLFDCKDRRPSPLRLLLAFEKYSVNTINSISEYSRECFDNSLIRNIKDDLQINCTDALSLTSKIEKKYFKKIQLVLTSPPYPGVHILYHRWQIKGRRQTALPFDLLDIEDGYPTSYYTLGSVSKKGYDNYFNTIRKIFTEINMIISKYATVVQIVSFKEPEWQLEQYLQSMREAGFTEMFLNKRKREIITREVPNRKWYTNLNDKKAIEYVLFHKKEQ